MFHFWQFFEGQAAASTAVSEKKPHEMREHFDGAGIKKKLSDNRTGT